MQEVAEAGKAKREELLEYLETAVGQELVAKVAKLLVYTRHKKVRQIATAQEGNHNHLVRTTVWT